MATIKVTDPAGKDKEALLTSVDTETKYHWNKKLRMKWTIIFFFGNFFVYSVRTSMSVCAPIMSKEMGWNKQISGMALSAFFCGYVSTNMLGGYLADRHGGERMIIYSATVWASMTLLLPYVGNSDTFMNFGTLAIIIARIITGMAQGFFYPSMTTIVLKRVPVNERALMAGMSGSGTVLGTIITGFVGSIIIEYFGWPLVFILLGLFSLVWVSIMRYFYYKTKQSNEESISRVKEPVPWLKLASKRPIWGLMIAYFCSGLTFYIQLSWTPVYFHDAFPQSKGWVFNVVPWLVSFVVLNVISYVANILLYSGTSVTSLRKTYAAILFIGVSVFSYMLTVVETFEQALFVMSIVIGLNAFSSPSIGLNAQDLCPKHAGALHGTVNSVAALAGIVGVYLTGYILETTHNWSIVFILTSVTSFAGFLGFQIFGSGEKVL